MSIYGADLCKKMKDKKCLKGLETFATKGGVGK